MLEQEKDPQICYNCDEEFVVQTPYDTEATVAFCPFCGSEVEGDIVELEFDEEGEDDDLLSDD